MENVIGENPLTRKTRNGANTSVERRRAVDVAGHERRLRLFSDRIVPHPTDATLRGRQSTRLKESFCVARRASHQRRERLHPVNNKVISQAFPIYLWGRGDSI